MKKASFILLIILISFGCSDMPPSESAKMNNEIEQSSLEPDLDIVSDIAASKLKDLIDELNLYLSIQQENKIKEEILTSIESKFDLRPNKFITTTTSQQENLSEAFANSKSLEIINYDILSESTGDSIFGKITYQLLIDKIIFDSCQINFFAIEKHRLIQGEQANYWQVKLR